MKKLLLSLSIALISLISFGQDEIVNILDTNFLKALIDNYVDKNKDGKIQKSEAIAPITLSISKRGIRDLTGIKEFTSVFSIDCSLNNLDFLDLSNMSNLFLFNAIIIIYVI